jgi:hypothetical protein
MEDMAHSDSSGTKLPGPELGVGFTAQKANGPLVAHPSGKESYGRFIQVLRGLAFGLYFAACCFAYVAFFPKPRKVAQEETRGG